MLPVALDVSPVSLNQVIAALLARLENIKLPTTKTRAAVVRQARQLALARQVRLVQVVQRTPTLVPAPR
jgi:hypothetical protein